LQVLGPSNLQEEKQPNGCPRSQPPSRQPREEPLHFCSSLSAISYEMMIIIMLIMIIIMKSSVERDNNTCHYVILRKAGFAITQYYHPAKCDVVIWLVDSLSSSL
jgi:hypothetical protein